MTRAKWCVLCERNVVPQKKFNWLVVIFLFGFLWYLPFYWLQRPRCPICGGTQFQAARTSEY